MEGAVYEPGDLVDASPIVAEYVEEGPEEERFLEVIYYDPRQRLYAAWVSFTRGLGEETHHSVEVLCAAVAGVTAANVGVPPTAEFLADPRASDNVKVAFRVAAIRRHQVHLVRRALHSSKG